VCTKTQGEHSVRRKIWERVPPLVP
jgi:hypothetical protein